MQYSKTGFLVQLVFNNEVICSQLMSNNLLAEGGGFYRAEELFEDAFFKIV